MTKIPVPTGHFWKAKLREFAKEHNVSELVVKRELSEISKHVRRMHVSKLESLDGRTSGFRWMAQPSLKEFDKSPEFRMFVINGRCCWGVATRFVKNEEEEGGAVTLEKNACAPGRKAWELEGGKEAAVVAEQVVKAVSQEMAHATRFLRVDMVKRDGGGWWINELEYFGNAFIHFEAFDNSPDMLDEVIGCLSWWLQGSTAGD
jgi:hypothetical protein